MDENQPEERKSAYRIVGGLLVAFGLIVMLLDRLPPGVHPDPRPEGWLFMAAFCLVVFGVFFITANRRPARRRPSSGKPDAPPDSK